LSRDPTGHTLEGPLCGLPTQGPPYVLAYRGPPLEQHPHGIVGRIFNQGE